MFSYYNFYFSQLGWLQMGKGDLLYIYIYLKPLDMCGQEYAQMANPSVTSQNTKPKKINKNSRQDKLILQSL